MKKLTILAFVVVFTAGAVGWYQFYQAKITVRLLRNAERSRNEGTIQAQKLQAGIFISGDQNSITVGIPRQIQRDGQTFVDIQNDVFKIMPNMLIVDLRGLPAQARSVQEIPAGSPIRIELSPTSTSGLPQDRIIVTTYVLAQ